ncbi:MAG: serine/threonine protein kinase [Myxococcales bacterium]|nr:serine/threonine protein kinase [Myxococcales bacterium]
MSTSSMPPNLLEPGDRLDRYELLCKIGQGGMASVWLARSHGLEGFERLVALKTVLPDHATDTAFRTMLIDEARIASSIDHPNVARILDVGEDRGVPFMVLDYIAGESLNRLQRVLAQDGKRIPYAIAVRVLADACSGLHVAHEMRGADGAPLNIVHRDVSPQNILVDDYGVAKVIDFGVAKAAGRLSAETATGIIKGKVAYMAPEQALGLPVDRRADVYAIGAVAFYLLAGKAPFDADNDAARILRAVNGGEPDPLPDGVPPALAAVIRRCLSRSPDDRYASAGLLRDALEASTTPATNTEVARFFQEHLEASVTSRRKMVDRAVGAATDRASQRKILSFEPTTDSHSHPRAVGPNEETSAGTVGALVGGPLGPSRKTRAVAVGVGAGLFTVAAFVIGVVALRATARPPDPEPPKVAVELPPSATTPVAAEPTPSATEPPPASSEAPAPSSSVKAPAKVAAGGKAAPRAPVAVSPPKPKPAATVKKPKTGDDTIF